jgi:hypothetical protein
MTADPDATGPSPAAGGTAGRLRDVTFTALVISVLSFVMAITGPIWAPRLYGIPSSAQIMVLGIAQLRPALLSDEPFRDQLSLVRGVMPSQPDVNQALDTLALYADKGVPTLPELQASFVGSANAIILADIVSTQSSGFDRAVISAAAALHLHALAHWLNDTRPASAIVWEAQAHLDAGDLAGASAVLGKLTGPEAKIARPWISAVGSRIAADQVLELLETVAQSRVGMPAQRS